MLVSYVVLCSIIIPAHQAAPLYLEIHHRDPQTGQILSTTEMEIESDVLNSENSQVEINSQERDENEIAALEYYYGCSMPRPPPIERSNFIDDVEEVEPTDAKSPEEIENVNSNLNVREPNSASDSALDWAIAGVNSLPLQLLSLGFRAYNRFMY